MENMIKEKRCVVRLEVEELHGYIKVPVNLFKDGLLEREELSRIACDLNEMDEDEVTYAQEVAQELFTEQEVNEIKEYFKTEKGTEVFTTEVELPVRFKGRFSANQLSSDYYPPYGSCFNYSKNNTPFSFELLGYCSYDRAEKKDEEKVKVWIAVRGEPPHSIDHWCLGQGELTHNKCSDEPSDMRFWAGEVSKELLKEAEDALCADSTLEKFFRYLESVEDKSLLANVK